MTDHLDMSDTTGSDKPARMSETDSLIRHIAQNMATYGEICHTKVEFRDKYSRMMWLIWVAIIANVIAWWGLVALIIHGECT